jgi:RNA exonuclease 1
VPWTNQGCTTSTHHVFKESDPLDLHARAGFISTADLPAPAAPTRLDVVALDCEMIYTTAGMTLARVTVVDEDGKSLLDELVRPDPARVL